MELLLAGLVTPQAGQLVVKNRIYAEIFNPTWIEQQLTNLRPYSQAFDAWLSSGKQDQSRLLRGNALQDAKTWAQGKSLSDLDYEFLGQSEDCDRAEVQQALEAARLAEVEARLQQEKKAARQQKILLLVVSLAFLLSTGFGLFTYRQYRQATQREIAATAASGSFNAYNRLNALLQAIQAKTKLQSLNVNHPYDPNLGCRI
ncbi:hypothetical protein PN462_17340 [Spirulina sp. CS-785/01]|uniref:hypothetical protein n=1 Tax=Spirulina sp. CS-785/01 TaxID=3021716 RepID=UPI00232FC05B|nr:hypothetical protein [Spirulina sp. CS-785/01]MDB9314882.1 hypothetical protein [Spirulina sp. CS-785/01]